MSEWWKNLQFPAPPAPAASAAVDQSPASSPAMTPRPGPAVSAPTGGAGKMDWGQLLQMLPVLLAGNPQNRGSFLEGLQRGRLLKQNQGNEDRMFGLRERDLEDVASSRRETQAQRANEQRERQSARANARVSELVEQLSKVTDPDAFKTLLRTWEGRLRNEFGQTYEPDTLLLRLYGLPAKEPDYKSKESAIQRILKQTENDDEALAMLQNFGLLDAARGLYYVGNSEEGPTLVRDPEKTAAPGSDLERQVADVVAAKEEELGRKVTAKERAAIRSAAAGQLADVRRPPEKGAPVRRVLSSDANRIAELDTSLDDINVLERDLGTTGTASRIGAALPNVVTELTGWGENAKQRQAVIDRVKQVIGKALEGGVLRKEDEYKYLKILPTIGDPPAVAGRKIKGLREAIQQRRQRLIESLEDAGYETSGYEGKDASDRPTTGTGSKPTLRFNPATGQVEPIP